MLPGRKLIVELRVTVLKLVLAATQKMGRYSRDPVEFRDAFSQRRRLYGAIKLYIHTVFQRLYYSYDGAR